MRQVLLQPVARWHVYNIQPSVDHVARVLVTFYIRHGCGKWRHDTLAIFELVNATYLWSCVCWCLLIWRHHKTSATNDLNHMWSSWNECNIFESFKNYTSCVCVQNSLLQLVSDKLLSIFYPLCRSNIVDVVNVHFLIMYLWSCVCWCLLIWRDHKPSATNDLNHMRSSWNECNIFGSFKTYTICVCVQNSLLQLVSDKLLSVFYPPCRSNIVDFVNVHFLSMHLISTFKKTWVVNVLHFALVACIYRS